MHGFDHATTHDVRHAARRATPISAITLITVRVVRATRSRSRRLLRPSVPRQTVFTEVPMLRKKITIESIALPM